MPSPRPQRPPVRELSLGSWVTYPTQVDTGAAKEMLAAAIKALKWPRLNYLVSTKFFWGLDREGHATNRKDTLNRK